MMELKRRNSDPATQLSSNSSLEVQDNPQPLFHQPKPPVTPSPSFELLTWKGTTMFTIAGHRFRKISRFSKDDRSMFYAQ